MLGPEHPVRIDGVYQTLRLKWLKLPPNIIISLGNDENEKRKMKHPDGMQSVRHCTSHRLWYDLVTDL